MTSLGKYSILIQITHGKKPAKYPIHIDLSTLPTLSIPALIAKVIGKGNFEIRFFGMNSI